MPDNTDRDPGGILGLTRVGDLGWTFHVQWVRHCVSMPKFTRENAAIYAKKGNDVRWSQEHRAKQPRDTIPTEYAEIVKYRVRGILDKTLDRFDDEDDANKIDRLASAVAKLAELDRQLSGRPLPGTLRPVVKAREKWSDLELPKAPEPVLAPAPDDAPEPDIAPEPRPANVLSDGPAPVSPAGLPAPDDPAHAGVSSPARDVFQVEQPESTSVELPTQDVVV